MKDYKMNDSTFTDEIRLQMCKNVIARMNSGTPFYEAALEENLPGSQFYEWVRHFAERGLLEYTTQKPPSRNFPKDTKMEAIRLRYRGMSYAQICTALNMEHTTKNRNLLANWLTNPPILNEFEEENPIETIIYNIIEYHALKDKSKAQTSSEKLTTLSQSIKDKKSGTAQSESQKREYVARIKQQIRAANPALLEMFIDGKSNDESLTPAEKRALQTLTNYLAKNSILSPTQSK